MGRYLHTGLRGVEGTASQGFVEWNSRKHNRVKLLKVDMGDFICNEEEDVKNKLSARLEHYNMSVPQDWGTPSCCI